MRALHHLFSELRDEYQSNHSKLKAMASELLCVYGLLRHWINCELGDEDTTGLEQHMESFNMCCRLVDICMLAKHREAPLKECATMLKTAAAQHLQKHMQVYGQEHIKPKHHWVFDVADQWMVQQGVLDGFVIEKAHLRSKPIAMRIDNTKQYESGLMSGIIWNQLENAKDMDECSSRLGPSQILPGYTAMISDSLHADGKHININDVVYRSRAEVGIVIACCEENGIFLLMVESCRLERALAIHSGVYLHTSGRHLWKVSEVDLARAH